MTARRAARDETGRVAPAYRAVDAALLRAAALPAHREVPAAPANDDPEQWRAWLGLVWSDPAVAAAISSASPAVAARVDQVLSGRRTRPGRCRSLGESVLRYLLRMTWRATPFGLFAGIAPARFGTGKSTVDPRSARVTRRVDAEWLAAATAELEAAPRAVHAAPVLLNPLAFERNGRLVVPHVRQRSAPEPAAEVSVRRTAAVQVVERVAARPTPMADLAAAVRGAFPSADKSTVDEMLGHLVERRILLTALNAPMTVTDPLGHLRSRNPVPVAERTGSADLRFTGTLVLPDAVAREAGDAVSLLARLSPVPAGTTRWHRFHHRFTERYGPRALVPLTDLVDTELGLGYPDGYRDSRAEAPARPARSERDFHLVALAQSRRTEIVLDEQMITDLAVGDRTPAPHLELGFTLHSRTRADLERGVFELHPLGLSRAAGTTAGRFLDLLDPADRDRMAREYAALPGLTGDALPIQVSSPPLYPATDNVARCPALLPNVLHLGEFPDTAGPDLIALDDLAVYGDAHRLHLVSISRRRVLQPLMFTAVELVHRAHPLVRLLCELTSGQSAVPEPFSWGIASRLPFLPRVRHGRTVLSPARWTVTSRDLPDPGASWREWTQAVDAWRARAEVTRAVLVGAGDRRLRLDLDDPAQQRLLRAELSRRDRLTLHEAPTPESFGWLDGHAHEVVVPVVSLTPPAPAPRLAGLPVTRASHGHLPGAGTWLYLKVYAHPGRHREILVDRVPSLLAAWPTPPDWWFLPYRDPDDHLRVRLRVGDDRGRVGRWATDLRARGLTSRVQLDTYLPELGRYGDHLLLRAAEDVFVADSAVVLARSDDTEPEITAAAGIVDIAAAFLDGQGEGMRWLVDNVPRTAAAPLPRVTGRSCPESDAWRRRRDRVAHYAKLRRADADLEPNAVLPTLLHLHCLRVNGVDPDAELRAHHIARGTAVSWLARR
ncbi:lantibiotic dehydratase [Actinokineospora sp. NBRC 105648]|uniref:lantibiotic dehydratase n=1 Tax=Actinokineospora sp. NBRC 105648 TaxID=3032206 RepID=UPI0024A3EADF|nr:lantibiotic dehydratase [Actinokineospora sp. NBRC 105648]GLZ42646.1 hypothetical protein Acsp05_62700 [Actinokineospora sp. NBRC 105648]